MTDDEFRRRANRLHEATGSAGALVGSGMIVTMGAPGLALVIIGMIVMAIVLFLVTRWEIDADD